MRFLAAAATGGAVALAAQPLAVASAAFARRSCARLIAEAESVRLSRVLIDRWLAWWGPGMACAAFVIGVVCGTPVLALPAVALVAVAPRVMLGLLVERRRKTLRRQLVPAMAGLANTSRSGMPIAQGLASVAAEMPQPLREEFESMVGESRGGRPLTRVLQDAKVRLGLEPFTLFATALQVQAERGGSATDLLDTLAENLRDQERLDRTMDSSTAGNRTSIFVLSMFPLVFLFAMLVLVPRETSLMFTTLAGQLMLLAAMALTCASASWSRSLLRFRV